MTYKVIAKHDNRAETLHRESDSIEELYAELEDEGYVVYFIEQEKQNEESNCLEKVNSRQRLCVPVWT